MVYTSNSQIAELMAKAAQEASEAADYNKTTEATMRASRAGLPLLQQVLEDKIIRQLPYRERNWEYSKRNPDYKFHDPQQKRIQHEMRIATGYLFEQIVGKLLAEAYPGCEITGNLELEYKGLRGHCDFMVLDHANNRVIIVECKAIKIFSAKEACDKKVYVDNDGYFSQVSIYMAAAKMMFPTYDVTGEWRVWAKRVDKSYRIPYPGTLDSAIAVAEEAMVKREQYNRACELMERGLYKEATDYLMEQTEALPEKIFENGYYNASCGFHYSPWSDLVVDKHGFFLDAAAANIELMIRCAKTKNETDCKILTELVDKVK